MAVTAGCNLFFEENPLGFVTLSAAKVLLASTEPMKSNAAKDILAIFIIVFITTSAIYVTCCGMKHFNKDIKQCRGQQMKAKLVFRSKGQC